LGYASPVSGDPHIDVRLSPWLDDDAGRRHHGLTEFDPEELARHRWVGWLGLVVLIAAFIGLAVFILTAH
jgi:hypothetical protein